MFDTFKKARWSRIDHMKLIFYKCETNFKINPIRISKYHVIFIYTGQLDYTDTGSSLYFYNSSRIEQATQTVIQNNRPPNCFNLVPKNPKLSS